MRRWVAGLFVVLGITASCSEGVAPEEAPLDGSWRDEHGFDTSSWVWFFQRHANGVTYGGHYTHCNPNGCDIAPIDTARVNYPDIVIRMVKDSDGNCRWWRSCTVSGRFLSKNRIEIAGEPFQR